MLKDYFLILRIYIVSKISLISVIFARLFGSIIVAIEIIFLIFSFFILSGIGKGFF